MPHPSSTPNFSRPLTSPLSTGGLDTPIRLSRSRLVLEEPPHTASLVNMPHRPSPRRPSPNKRLFNIPGNQNRGPAEPNGASPSASTEAGHIQNLSKLSLTGTNGSRSSVNSVDLGGLDKPIPNFRPHLWRHLDQQREVLNIDLFWPINLDDEGGKGQDNEDEDEVDEDKDVFPYADLKPLVTFHNLHYLQINGMMRSYQPLIFATCWVNKKLTQLHLEMAQEPEMKPISSDTKLKYRLINEKWSYDSLAQKQTEYCEYLGYHGEGILHEEFGYGEYLDQQAIKVAQVSVSTELPLENLRFLPITHLTLKNFVIDAGPFIRWFDAKRLREITFRGDCVDAGFYLPQEMKSTVKVNAPKPKPKPLAVARWVKPGEVKLVEIKRRNSPAGNGVGVGGPAMPKDKPSPMMLGCGAKTKDTEVAKDKKQKEDDAVVG